MLEKVAPVFKLRAERMRDVGELLRRIHAVRVEIVGVHIGGDTRAAGADLVVTIEQPSDTSGALDLAAVRAVAAEVEGGQVMAETLAPIAEYTGKMPTKGGK